MSDDQETKDLLRAVGRAIEEQAKATRYVLAVGFVVIAVLLLLICFGAVTVTVDPG